MNGLGLAEMLGRLRLDATEDRPADSLDLFCLLGIIDLEGLAEPALLEDSSKVGQIAGGPFRFVGNGFGPPSAAAQDLGE